MTTRRQSNHREMVYRRVLKVLNPAVRKYGEKTVRWAIIKLINNQRAMNAARKAKMEADETLKRLGAL